MLVPSDLVFASASWTHLVAVFRGETRSYLHGAHEPCWDSKPRRLEVTPRHSWRLGIERREMSRGVELVAGTDF